MKKMDKTKKITYMAFFIAISIILSRFMSITTPILKITFSFIPIALSAMLFGPLYGGMVSGLTDLIGALLFPVGPYFPGFTFSAIISGVIYGLLLYNKEKSISRLIITNLLISLIVSCGLNTLWIILLYNKGFIAIIGPRIIKEIIMLPIKVTTLFLTWKYLGKRLEKNYNK